MYKVVDTVGDLVDMDDEPEPERAPDDTRRRHRLMTLGHDPLKP